MFGWKMRGQMAWRLLADSLRVQPWCKALLEVNSIVVDWGKLHGGPLCSHSLFKHWPERFEGSKKRILYA